MSAPIRPPTVIDRYFSLHYGPSLASHTPSLPSPDPFEDVCIARHHNGICVVCLSPRHPIVEQRLKVISVEYRVEMRPVKGKRKTGGIVVDEKTRLCVLKCEAGQMYTVKCAVKGTLAEYNDSLKEKPELIGQRPLTDGYLAVVLPWPKRVNETVTHLLNQEDYEERVSKALEAR